MAMNAAKMKYTVRATFTFEDVEADSVAEAEQMVTGVFANYPWSLNSNDGEGFDAEHYMVKPVLVTTDSCGGSSL